MAFQALMGGSECSTSNNPLNSLLKQQQTDHSLHHQPSTFNPQNAQSMRTMTPQMSQMNTQEAEQFFQQQQGMGMEGMRRELDNLANRGAIKGDREWSSQYSPASSQLSSQEFARMDHQFRLQQHKNHPSAANRGHFAAEFSNQQRQFTPSPSSQQQPSSSSTSTSSFNRGGGTGFAPSYGSYSGMGGMGGMTMNTRMGPILQNPLRPQEEQVGKGKGRFIELDDQDWEKEFEKASSLPRAPKSQEEEVGRVEDKELSKANLLEEGEIDLDASESDAQLMKDLESTWSQLKDQLKDSSTSDKELAEWEAQYGSQFNDIHGEGMFDEDEDGMFGLPEVRRGKEWTRENVDGFLQDQSPFPFAEENEYLDAQDPYAEGMRLLSEGAPLSEAALAFEAACRKDETRAEAWKAAGETWAADEREAKGIRALEKAVACGGPDGVAAWMSLAVAYVNEGQELRALATLEKWISLSYPSIALPPATSQQSMRTPWDASNRVIDLFLSAAQAGPQSRAEGQGLETNAIVDPDVQVGLGVLFYSNSDYERAKDCFEAGLSVRPDDFLLWNRLGATLANGGLPEEAISAYRKALELRPTFTRATYNLGVSCLNIGCYREAAEHLLAAIQGQMTREANTMNKGKGKAGDEDVGRSRPIGEADDGSANLWHTLRRAFLCMERHDLADKAFPGANVDEFRQEGFEF